MANVGNVDYEDGSVFIDLKTVAYSKDADVEGADDARRAQTGGAAQLVRRLQDLGDGVDGKLGDSTLRLFGSDAGVAASAVDDDDEDAANPFAAPEAPSKPAAKTRVMKGSPVRRFLNDF